MMNEANIPHSSSSQTDLLSELERSLEVSEPETLEDVFATSTETTSSPELSDQLLNLFAIAESSPLEAGSRPTLSPEPIPAPDQTDWQSLAQTLQTENQALHQSVEQLKQALAEAQQHLETQKQRSHHADTLIAQQAEELNKTQEQTSHLLNELDASQQTAQRQQLLIETLTEQLEIRQAQVAQLERECVLIQEDYNEQAQKLIASDKQIRELQSRLYRQQRYTLQYKAALEQRLGASTADVPGVTLPTAQSIQPWSSPGASPDQESISIATPSTLPTDEIRADAEILQPEALPEDSHDSPPQSTPPVPSRSRFFAPLIASEKRPPKGMIDLPSFLRNR